MHRVFALAACLLAVSTIAVAGCGGSDSPTETAEVTGTVTYLQRIAMPGDATIHLTLHDMTLVDAESVLLGSQTITDPGEVPVAFSIEYDPSRVIESSPYAVTATILSEGEPWMTNTEVVPVITDGAPTSDVEVVVAPMDG